MSEPIAAYNVNPSLPATLGAFRSRSSAEPYASDAYVPPTPEEVAQLIKLAGWSQTDAAKLVGVSYNKKGSTTIRKWKTSKAFDEHRAIPYAAWRHLLACAGVVKAEEDIIALTDGCNGNYNQ